MPKSTRAVRRHHHRPESLKCHCRTNQQVSITLLIDILRGNPTAEITEKAYTELKTFGAGRDIPARDWQDYLLQMLQMGYFEIAYNENNHLKITGSGSDVLFGRERAMLVVIRREEPATAKEEKRVQPPPHKHGQKKAEAKKKTCSKHCAHYANSWPIRRHSRLTSYCQIKYCICSVCHVPRQSKPSVTSTELVNIKRKSTEKILLP